MSDEMGEKSVDTEAVEKSGIIPPSPPSSEKNTTNIIEQGEYIGLQQDEEGELEQTQQQKEALVRNGDSSSFKMGYEPLQIDSSSSGKEIEKKLSEISTLPSSTFVVPKEDVTNPNASKSKDETHVDIPIDTHRDNSNVSGKSIHYYVTAIYIHFSRSLCPFLYRYIKRRSLGYKFCYHGCFSQCTR